MFLLCFYIGLVDGASSLPPPLNEGGDCSQLSAHSPVDYLAEKSPVEGILERLIFLGNVGQSLAHCRDNWAPANAVRVWDTELCNQINKEFKKLDTEDRAQCESAFGSSVQLGKLVCGVLRDRRTTKMLEAVTEERSDLVEELRVRLEPKNSHEAVKSFDEVPVLYAFMPQVAFCSIFDDLLKGETVQLPVNPVSVQVFRRLVEDRARQCKRNMSAFFKSLSSTSPGNEISDILAYLRNRIERCMSVNKLSKPWDEELSGGMDSASQVIESINIVRQEMIQWGNAGNPLRLLSNRLFSGLKGCVALPSVLSPDLKLTSPWNPYYQMLTEAFESVSKKSLFSGLILLAGVDQWLSKCRIQLGETDGMVDWQSQADFVRDKAAVLFFQSVNGGGAAKDGGAAKGGGAVKGGGDSVALMFSGKQDISDTAATSSVCPLVKDWTDPVKGWRLAEQCADFLAHQGKIIKLDVPTNCVQSSQSVKDVVGWRKSLHVVEPESVEALIRVGGHSESERLLNAAKLYSLKGLYDFEQKGSVPSELDDRIDVAIDEMFKNGELLNYLSKTTSITTDWQTRLTSMFSASKPPVGPPFTDGVTVASHRRLRHMVLDVRGCIQADSSATPALVEVSGSIGSNTETDQSIHEEDRSKFDE